MHYFGFICTNFALVVKTSDCMFACKIRYLHYKVPLYSIWKGSEAIVTHVWGVFRQLHISPDTFTFHQSGTLGGTNMKRVPYHLFKINSHIDRGYHIKNSYLLALFFRL